MKKQYLECGKIVTSHGIKGELKLYPWCDDIHMFDEIDELYLDDKGERKLVIEQCRVHKNMVILKFKGYDTVDDAMKLRNEIVYLHRDDIPMEDGEFFIQDLLGVQVFDADTGKLYGSLVDVTETGANQVYHIRFEEGETRLIPAIPDVVIGIDFDAGRMDIRPLKGLFEDEQAIIDN